MAVRDVELLLGRSVHPIYREQLHAVPHGWRYRSEHPSLTQDTTPTKLVVERGARFASVRALAERSALRMLATAGHVRRSGAGSRSSAALVHSGEVLLRDPGAPYVLDFEHAALFLLYQPATIDRPWARRTLERALMDERLRFLLGWSDAACRSLAHVVSPDVAAVLAPKLRTVRPAIRPFAEHARTRGEGPLRLLFVGTKFYEKGAVEAVQALRLARAEHDVTLQMVSYVPQEWSERLAGEPGLTIYAPGGADLVQRLYRESDALLFPSHMDTFGYVIAEAMAHALPVLTARHLALTELVSDEVSGLLFAPENMLYDEQARLRFRHVLPPPKDYLRALEHPGEEYVESIAKSIGRLAADRGLYDRLSRGALESVKSGVFSMEARRASLAEVYDAAAA